MEYRILLEVFREVMLIHFSETDRSNSKILIR